MSFRKPSPDDERELLHADVPALFGIGGEKEMTGHTCRKENSGTAAWKTRMSGGAGREATAQVEVRRQGHRVEAGGAEVTAQCASHPSPVKQSLCGLAPKHKAEGP